MKIIFAILALFLATGQLRAEPSSEYPTTLKIEDKELTRRGWGFRTATWFKVKVYHAGLYVEDVKAEPLISPGVKVIDLTFVHDVNQPDMVKAWKDSFAKNCGSACGVPGAIMEKFLENLKAAKVGDKYRYIFAADRVEVQMASGGVAKYADPKFAKLLLSTWIGEFPPTETLKKSLLGP